MKKIIMLIFFLNLFTSCGGYREGVIQKTEKGQIKFIGNTIEASVSIDNGELFKIGKIDALYQIKPGLHLIKIYKKDQLVLNRNVYVDNGVIMEIDIP